MRGAGCAKGRATSERVRPRGESQKAGAQRVVDLPSSAHATHRPRSWLTPDARRANNARPDWGGRVQKPQRPALGASCWPRSSCLRRPLPPPPPTIVPLSLPSHLARATSHFRHSSHARASKSSSPCSSVATPASPSTSAPSTSRRGRPRRSTAALDPTSASRRTTDRRPVGPSATSRGPLERTAVAAPPLCVACVSSSARRPAGSADLVVRRRRQANPSPAPTRSRTISRPASQPTGRSNPRARKNEVRLRRRLHRQLACARKLTGALPAPRQDVFPRPALFDVRSRSPSSRPTQSLYSGDLSRYPSSEAAYSSVSPSSSLRDPCGESLARPVAVPQYHRRHPSTPADRPPLSPLLSPPTSVSPSIAYPSSPLAWSSPSTSGRKTAASSSNRRSRLSRLLAQLVDDQPPVVPNEPARPIPGSRPDLEPGLSSNHQPDVVRTRLARQQSSKSLRAGRRLPMSPPPSSPLPPLPTTSSPSPACSPHMRPDFTLDLPGLSCPPSPTRGAPVSASSTTAAPSARLVRPRAGPSRHNRGAGDWSEFLGVGVFEEGKDFRVTRWL